MDIDVRDLFQVPHRSLPLVCSLWTDGCLRCVLELVNMAVLTNMAMLTNTAMLTTGVDHESPTVRQKLGR
jgi:hypothetical protein